MKRQLVEFRVQGQGKFPVTLLAVEQCWPLTMDDAISIQAEAKDWPGLRQILLVSTVEPNRERWAVQEWPIIAMREIGSRTPEREQYLADIIITAVEGGSGYWASFKAYRHSEPATTSVYVRDYETKDAAWVFVGLDQIEGALGRIIRGDGVDLLSLSERVRQHIVKCDQQNDAGNIDADDADCILQIAVYGKIIFG